MTLTLKFPEFIKESTILPPDQEKKIRSLIRPRHIKKSDYFVHAGHISRDIAYVKTGLFRYFYSNEEGEEYTKGFFDRGSVLSSYDAILEDNPSHYTIQALEHSTIEVVDYDKFHELFTEDPCWYKLLVGLLQKGYLAKVRRERELLLYDAEERYRLFRERTPALEGRIPQHLIASYLGVTPVTLSRVRNKMGLVKK